VDEIRDIAGEDEDRYQTVGTVGDIEKQTLSGTLLRGKWFPTSQLRSDHHGRVYASVWILEEKGLL
jgi:hypothetical protein